MILYIVSVMFFNLCCRQARCSPAGINFRCFYFVAGVYSIDGVKFLKCLCGLQRNYSSTTDDALTASHAVIPTFPSRLHFTDCLLLPTIFGTFSTNLPYLLTPILDTV